MPKVKRMGLPRDLMAHLLDRVFRRNLTEEELYQVLHWLETDPTVPEGKWFKRFGKITVVGEGELVKSLFTPQQTAHGTEVE